MSKGDPEHLLPQHAPKESAEHDAGKEGPEKDIWEGTYSAKEMIGTWVSLAFATLVLVGIMVYLVMGVEFVANNAYYAWLIFALVLILMWGIPLGSLAHKKLSVKYKLTTRRLIHGEGLLVHKTDQVELRDVQDISMQQNLLERMVGAGSITIVSTDRSHPELTLPGIDKVAEVKDTIEAAWGKVQRKMVHHRAD